ncbi:replication-relaxation family protein [Streptacidiphilus rugosus]|uniref:replication-relaxation family protein n=1 Tax=Streptacidiphilus rugosus TaxID=405783 RepID=UPI00068F11C8|nr:replication-relaxation family protein [Streptacidiphilus rugosus]
MTDIDVPYTVLACLYLHRMATTAHLHHLVGIARQQAATRRLLRELAADELVISVNLPGPGRTKLWLLTAAGRDLCQAMPEVRGREYPLVQGTHLRRRAPHSLDVLRTHLAFLAEARQRGDEYGPLDWEPEVYHRLSDQRADAVIADALMRYTINGPSGSRRQLRAFVEVDRATMSSERLASKLMAYGRFLDYTPLPVGAARRRQTTAVQVPVWQRSYPVYPRVLFVLTGASRTVMERRVADLQAMAVANPLAARLAQVVPLGAAILEDLQEQGPSAPVWTPLAGDDLTRRGWSEL